MQLRYPLLKAAVVDTSALVSVVFNEPERLRFLGAISVIETALVSTATVVEARMVVHGRAVPGAVEQLDAMLTGTPFQMVPVSAEEAQVAHAAFMSMGKGSGHPAQLNFGDLFSYALAKSRNLPLLYKGEDFAQTDIVSALALVERQTRH
jgi:ribonuclease VapC